MITRITAKLLAVGALAAAAVAAPAMAPATLVHTVPPAYAEPVPDPGPDPLPQPGETGAIGADDCGPGDVRGVDGNCVPDMGASTGPVDVQPEPELAPRTTQDTTSSSVTGEGANLVPNINGDSCTGYWQSVACYEMDQDNVPVQPRSTLSSSP
jgi:hypothetical protein